MGTSTGGSAQWLLYDLLGSVAASQAAGSGTTGIVDALRYDAYGQTLGLAPAGGSTLGLRFRGLVDLAPTADPDVAGAGSDALYQMGARAYAPHLGTFTTLDTYAGTAQDPISLNRYLYAHANPASLIDPSGHSPRSMHDGAASTNAATGEPTKSNRGPNGTTVGGDGTSSTGNTNAGGAEVPPEASLSPVDFPGSPIDQALAFARLEAWRNEQRRHDCLAGDEGACEAADMHSPLDTILLIEASNIPASIQTLKSRRLAGKSWERTVLRELEATFDRDLYEIRQDRALRNLNGETVRINGKYFRPDFQVLNRATGRLAAIYEAKSGTVAYLTRAMGKIAIYKTAAGMLGYAAPPVIPKMEVRPTARFRPGLGAALGILGIVSISASVFADQAEADRLQREWRMVNDVDPDLGLAAHVPAGQIGRHVGHRLTLPSARGFGAAR